MRLEPFPADHADHDSALRKVRSVRVGRPFAWLAAAWRDLCANPIASLALSLIHISHASGDHPANAP